MVKVPPPVIICAVLYIFSIHSMTAVVKGAGEIFVDLSTAAAVPLPLKGEAGAA
jgi:hypothetical protein